MKKIMIVFGTRPEAIKMSPLVKELKSRDAVSVKVCVTGQHREMLNQVLKVFDIEPDYNLDIMSTGQDLFDITSRILLKMRDVLKNEVPDLVLVHGDTTTTFATSLACFYLQIPVGHVEAGLRTFNINSPFPEEYNRRAVSLVSQYNFAPTEKSKHNLIKEGIAEDTIWVTGNTAIDALKTTVIEDFKNEHLDWVGDDRLILITAHRRENLGAPMINMFKAIKRVMDEHDNVKAIYPIHMNPLVRSAAEQVFGKQAFESNNSKIRIIEPLDVVSFHNFLNKSYLILTDSGGIQEEAPSLGKPVLVMRDTTERPEGIMAGTLQLVGTEEENIYVQFKKLIESKEAYEKMSKAVNPYGDGMASKRIANLIINGRMA